MTLKFFNEAQFSYVHDAHIYATYNGGGSTLRTIDQYDFSTAPLHPSARPRRRGHRPGRHARRRRGARAPARSRKSSRSSAAPIRTSITTWSCSTRTTRRSRRLLDTAASTLDGSPDCGARSISTLHHATIDRSGRYVVMYPTASVELAAPRKAEHVYVWDTELDVFIETPDRRRCEPGRPRCARVRRARQSGLLHDDALLGCGGVAAPRARVAADAARPGLAGAATEAHLSRRPPVVAQRAARPRTPFVSALYRYGAEASAWRAWDDEIIAVQTDAAPGTIRDRVAARAPPQRRDERQRRRPASFWYTPRPSVSPDGRWVLFTSNWEKTLGLDPRGEPGGGFRQDVFLVKAR